MEFTNDYQRLAQMGIVGLPAQWLNADVRREITRQQSVYNNTMAFDAAPLLAENNGVPAWMTTYTSPDVVKTLLAPVAAENIFPPEKNGELGVMTAAFPVAEETGAVATYGDYSEEGASGENYNWPKRDEYMFQTMTLVGDMKAKRMGMVGINAVESAQQTSANVIKRAHNKIWFYGLAGMRNYGILNDPQLLPAVPPVPDSAAKLTWNDKGADGIYNDFVALFTKLMEQTFGLIPDGLSMDAELRVCFSNRVASSLKKKNEHGVSVQAMLKEAFPSMSFVVAPEYSTASGELVQMFAPAIDGQKTGMLGYTELLHAHGMVRETSSFKEKKSAGNFGAIITQPVAIAQMIGV